MEPDPEHWAHMVQSARHGVLLDSGATVILSDRGGVHTARKRWRCEAAPDDVFTDGDPVGYQREPDDPVYLRAADCERVIEPNRQYIADETQNGFLGFSETRLCVPCGVANFGLEVIEP